jgi:hypothetical protein
VLDDLELANADQPDQVVRVFRTAVQEHLAGLGGHASKTGTVLQEKVSFHLIVPMIEAWFFGDAGALKASGMNAATSPALEAADVEAFQTSDPTYLAATEELCPCWLKKKNRKDRPKWHDLSTRSRHPKGYLQWLCLDGSAKNCTTYHETSGGGAALAGLCWASLLEQPASHSGYLRALLADLEDALGQPTMGPIGEDSSLPIATRLSSRPRNPVVRNL